MKEQTYTFARTGSSLSEFCFAKPTSLVRGRQRTNFMRSSIVALLSYHLCPIRAAQQNLPPMQIDIKKKKSATEVADFLCWH